MTAHLYITLVRLYDLVVGWAREYVPEPVARKVGRSALAESFPLAAAGFQTPSGPYHLVSENALLALSRLGGIQVWERELEASLSVPLPQDNLLMDVAELWTWCHSVSLHGRLTLNELQSIRARLLVTDWQGVVHKSHTAIMIELNASHPALRRAFDLFEQHERNGCLFCTAVGILRHDEMVASRDWAATYAATKGVPWHDQSGGSPSR